VSITFFLCFPKLEGGRGRALLPGSHKNKNLHIIQYNVCHLQKKLQTFAKGDKFDFCIYLWLACKAVAEGPGRQI
jgi:hypothetical protein